MVISFSGGRSSALMTYMILNDKSYTDKYIIIVIFANTGEEHEGTLTFIKNCDEYFNFNTVWVESVVYHGERKGTGYKLVDYKTASRKGEPFEEVIKKYGIPNKKFPHCTRELKLSPITSYMKSLGLNFKNCTTAIGIRADEQRRVSKSADVKNIIYPLVGFGIEKSDVISWWEDQPFNLNILEREGNCKWCWKKSDKKLFANMTDHPEWFDFPKRMEHLYPRVGKDARKNENDKVNRVFFRGARSTKTLIETHELSKNNLLPTDESEIGGCSESCEVFTMDLGLLVELNVSDDDIL